MDSDQRACSLAVAIQFACSAVLTDPFHVFVHRTAAPLTGSTFADCGHVFIGEVSIVESPGRGRSAISERSLHHLAHGRAIYETGDVLDSRPMRVEIDLSDWEAFIRLGRVS